MNLCIATFYDHDEPVELFSIFAGILVLIVFRVLRHPERMSVARAMAVMTLFFAMFLFGSFDMLIAWSRPGPHECEALVSFFILLAGIFGAGLACTRCPETWVAVIFAVVAFFAAVVITAIAVNVELVRSFWVGHRPTPIRTLAVIIIVWAALIWRLWQLYRRLARPSLPPEA